MDKGSGWIKKHPDEIINALGSNKLTGLTDRSVQEIKARLGRNDLWYTGNPLMFLRHESGFSAVGYVVMLTSALSAAAFNKCNDSLFVTLSLILGVIISLFFYVYAGIICKNQVSKWIPKCTVVRDGKILRIRGDHLVVGDIVILSKSDVICADMKLIETDEFFINDVSAKKRNEPVQKFAVSGALTSDNQIATVPDYIFAGSNVVSGNAKAVVCAVGTDTLIGKKGKIKLVPDREPSSLTAMRKLGFTSGTFAMIASFAAVALGVFSPASATDFIGLFLIFLAFSVSSGGEILPALSCFSFAVSIKKGADNNLVIRDFSAIDILRNSDGIAVENSTLMKTGDSVLKSIWISGKNVDIGSNESDEFFSILLAGSDYGKGKYGIDIIGAVEKNLGERGDSERFIAGVKTTKVVLENKKEGTSQYSLYVSGGEHYFSITGSIEEVISCCTKMDINGKSVPLDKNNLTDVLSSASEAIKNATSLIAVAVRKSPYNSMKRLSVLSSDMTFMGFIAVDTPTDPELISDLLYLNHENIPFVLFSDGSGEDVNFARKCGILRDRNEMINGHDSDVVNKVLSEKSQGGVIIAQDDPTITNILITAKKSGKQIVCVGESDVFKGCGINVVQGDAVPGSGAFIKDSKQSKVTCVLETIKKLRNISLSFLFARKLLQVSLILRGIYAISAIFGMPFVYPSVILAWGLVLDVLLAVIILISDHKKRQN